MKRKKKSPYGVVDEERRAKAENKKDSRWRKSEKKEDTSKPEPASACHPVLIKRRPRYKGLNITKTQPVEVELSWEKVRCCALCVPDLSGQSVIETSSRIIAK
ncbi:hypothetical protein LSTR_LSTR003817 [Laodelphax striatellus]|uniref:Uncharacterized protein n=1 Tax=Laodelphax striatellus TaxID=195883 RepID=A0A482XEN7_LAOST|nr:hypothetical protein LSTR_LSTR003817 [Laodelphax striatellus]